jgi:hypothetical protein
MPLKGKYALITGNSRRIGRGIALKLAEQGGVPLISAHINAEKPMHGIRSSCIDPWRGRDRDIGCTSTPTGASRTSIEVQDGSNKLDFRHTIRLTHSGDRYHEFLENDGTLEAAQRSRGTPTAAQPSFMTVAARRCSSKQWNLATTWATTEYVLELADWVQILHDLSGSD